MGNILERYAENLMFWSFEFRAFEFVSDFELRHSDLNSKHF